MAADLRSDTVTRPTQGMIEAMMTAPVGDDVFGEDPTVNALQERLADMFGHEAGLFCPSGTMTNQIAINVHTQPGDEVICDRLSHIYNYEGGGIARNSGASVRLLHGDRGRFTLEDVMAEVNPGDSHYARTSLVSAEDTCNKGGGSCWDVSELLRISEWCRTQNLPFHLDGARVFNALVARGNDVKAYGELFDSVSICMSKGLGTPAGSVLLGSKAFIKEANRTRKVIGGGMRQVGILAAAGLYALDHQLPLLVEDHERAKSLASTLGELTWVRDIQPVDTNIVIFDVSNNEAAKYCDLLKSQSVFCMPFGPSKIRFVTHRDFSEQDLEYTTRVLRSIS